MRRMLAVIAMAASLAATAAAAAPDFASMQVQRFEPPKPAPAFELPDLGGRLQRLADLKGKVVMLFFWATWCPDCLKELPSVNALYEAFKDRGLEVRLVNFREEAALVRKTAQDRGYKAPVLLDASGDVTGRAYGVWGPPTLYFIDRQGQLVGRVTGTRGWDTPQARAFVQALLDIPVR